MGAALRTAVRAVLGSLVSHCLLNELHCLCVMGAGARTPVQTSVILYKALALDVHKTWVLSIPDLSPSRK